MEAERLLEERATPISWRDLFGRDPILRRKALKQVMYRLPLRPIGMFFVLYFFKLGFLDGRAGFHYAVLRSIYEYLINLKMKELKFRRNGGEM